jgi:hypothetical protein
MSAYQPSVESKSASFERPFSVNKSRIPYCRDMNSCRVRRFSAEAAIPFTARSGNQSALLMDVERYASPI